jgi:phosphoglucosamine mutase
MSLGRAAAAATASDRPGVLIVRDTRESGPMLEAALAAGVASAGGDALMAGVLPTPAAAVLARRHGLELAAVVSASHNPYGDNGIKFFSGDGFKLDDGTEERIEALLKDPPAAGATRFGRVRELSGGLGDYLRTLEEAFPLDLSGAKVMLDCAHGSTYSAAPAIFERLGAEVETIAAEPDGRNINEDCGSTHLPYLEQRIAGSGASVGFAFDGDGDRVLAVDGSGTAHDGDELIALIAEHLSGRGALGGGVAVTVMTNFGFHRAMEAAGVEVATTPVGDRNVLEQLRERGWKLGGEQSGHIIAMDYAPTGDGIAAALLTMQALAGRELGAVAAMEKLPQTLLNVRVSDLDAVAGAARVWEAAEAENEALAGRGRVLVRPSGTEPLVRVMVEAPEAVEAERVAERLAELVRRELS